MELKSREGAVRCRFFHSIFRNTRSWRHKDLKPVNGIADQVQKETRHDLVIAHCVLCIFNESSRIMQGRLAPSCSKSVALLWTESVDGFNCDFSFAPSKLRSSDCREFEVAGSAPFADEPT